MSCDKSNSRNYGATLRLQGYKDATCMRNEKETPDTHSRRGGQDSWEEEGVCLADP